jgi:hypothetical protein
MFASKNFHSSRFRGKPFAALGELDVFTFAVAGFLADNFVDLDAFAADTTERAGRTLEVGMPAPTVRDSRLARTPRSASVSGILCPVRPNRVYQSVGNGTYAGGLYWATRPDR